MFGEVVTLQFTALDTLGNQAIQELTLEVIAPDHQIRHLINRATFGITPSLMSKIKSMGATAYLTQQLNPDSIDDDEFDALKAGFSVNTLDDLIRYQLGHTQYSNKQLQEVMTWFWENHFNTDIHKHGNVQYELDENEAFRSNALGNFRDLLGISAKSPAMLVYLDNDSNVKSAPNENYARELMELHTLGVSGGYTEEDVREVARAFTGWTILNEEFHFDASEHDEDEKNIMNQTIDIGGLDDGEQVLDLLANHASTADFLCSKLITYFVSDSSVNTLQSQCETKFLATTNATDQIAQVIQLILSSNQSTNDAHYLSKIKSPLELLSGTVRAFGFNYNEGADALLDMGMPLFANHIPTGYSDTADDWINSHLLLERFQFLNDYTYSRIGGNGMYCCAKAFFVSSGYETKDGIIGFLFEYVLGDTASSLEWETAINVLTDDGSNSFNINASNAEQKLRRLISTVLNYPAYQYQ